MKWPMPYNGVRALADNVPNVQLDSLVIECPLAERTTSSRNALFWPILLKNSFSRFE